MKHNLSTIFIVILVVVVFVLGYFIYQQVVPQIFQENVTKIDETVKDNFSSRAAEVQVLQWPSQTASDEEKQRHAELIRSLAQASQVLLITKDCTVSPVVIQIEEGGSIVVQNKDSLSHTLHQEISELNVIIPAQKEQTIIADFPIGPGDYGYGCDNKLGIVGIFHVVPQ